MTSEFPLSVLAAITELNTGGSVVVRAAHRAALVSPATDVDAERLRLHEDISNAPSAVIMGAERFDAWGFRLAPDSSLPLGPSVDLSEDVFTAMSRAGRAATIRALAGVPQREGALRHPGHVTPVRASEGNLLTRVGLVEAVADLFRLAGQPEVALFSFLLGEDGPIDPSTDPLPESTAGRPVVDVDEIRTACLVRAAGRPADEVEQLFIDAMVRVPAGVSVITTSEDGEPVGLVVSSLISYSANPPSVLVSIAHSSRSHGPLTTSEHFGVNILAHDQAEVAKVFSSRAADRFGSVDWSWEEDVPRLAESQTFLRCRRIATYTFGDHTLVIGSILSGDSRPVPPLVYVNRGFDGRLSR